MRESGSTYNCAAKSPMVWLSRRLGNLAASPVMGVRQIAPFCEVRCISSTVPALTGTSTMACLEVRSSFDGWSGRQA